MKRFYTSVSLSEDGSVLLDEKPVRTPKRNLLRLPVTALATAVAAEWAEQGEDIQPQTMKLTALANAAIDIVTPEPARFAAALAAYGETDLLCYRADDPPDLVARQNAAWNGLLAWAQNRYDVAFTVVSGIMHAAQPATTVTRLQQALAKRSAFELAALHPIVTIGGSLIVALAVLEGRVEAADAFDICHTDEYWQAATWGEDYFAQQSRDAHRADFVAAAQFLSLLG